MEYSWSILMSMIRASGVFALDSRPRWRQFKKRRLLWSRLHVRVLREEAARGLKQSDTEEDGAKHTFKYDINLSIVCPGTCCLLYSTKLHNADVKSVNDINPERRLRSPH
jgi:hypothetical protein